jgi:CTP:molybdopterin cytidylyltransferase MocA
MRRAGSTTLAEAGCIVLAAGAGRRFGGPKQVALWRGRPLLAWTLDAALGVTNLDPVVVVLGAYADAVRAAVNLSRVRVVVAPGWEEGQAASLRAGVAALGHVAAAVVLLGDMPFVTAHVVAGALEQMRPGCDAVRTTYRGRPGHPVVLGRRVLDQVPDLRGDVGARVALRHVRVAEFEAGHLCDSTDIDTRRQLEVLS